VDRACRGDATPAAKLIILDTQADVFGGDEIQRNQVRAFIGMLRGLALNNELAVLLLSHPSLTGLNSGTGTSGSTAWNNSLRSRLYFERSLTNGGKEEADPDLRILTGMKANYGRKGNQVRVRWDSGRFKRDDEGVSTDRLAGMKVAEQTFLDLVKLYELQGREVSPNPSKTYAPTVFAAHPDAKGITAKAFSLAMERLLKDCKIHVEALGPKSKRRKILASGGIPS
jgi:RecA-family ATPase